MRAEERIGNRESNDSIIAVLGAAALGDGARVELMLLRGTRGRKEEGQRVSIFSETKEEEEEKGKK